MKKSTIKKSLLFSFFSMMICIAILLGTTFAWFTDTLSSTGSITSGTLIVNLINEDGEIIDQPLEFISVEDEPVVWIPGGINELPVISVRNDGDVAAKYKFVITGIIGDEELNEVIEWSVNGLDIDTEFYLLPGQTESDVTITVRMKEDAGEEYHGLSISGISLAVDAAYYRS